MQRRNMKVDFQIIHSLGSEKSLKEKLLDLLKETFDPTISSIAIEEKPEKIEDWSIFDCIEIKYNYRSNKKRIAGFTLNTETINTEEDFEDLADNYGQKLKDNSNIIYLVIKYNDEAMQTEHQKYAKEIFDLEMKLREVISFIFLDTYKEDYYNLLRDLKVQTQSLSKNNKPDKNYHKSHFENEFFFLAFSDYLKLKELKEINHSDLIGMISDSKNYEDLKQKVQSRGISKEKYKDFLARINDYLEPIENLRNCIAHNRSIPKSGNDMVRYNYNTAKKKLENSIDDFWAGIRNKQARKT